LNRSDSKGFGVYFAVAHGETKVCMVKEGGAAAAHGGVHVGMKVWAINNEIVYGVLPTPSLPLLYQQPATSNRCG